MIFNMGEDECDLFSEKLGDIHLVSTRQSKPFNDQQPSNQSVREFLHKKTDADSSGSNAGFTSQEWHHQIFEDSLQPVGQDIMLPNLGQDEFSLDLSHEFIDFSSPLATSDPLHYHNNSISSPISLENGSFASHSDHNNMFIPVTVNSPVFVSRSRAASPNPIERTGSEKKRAKFEKTECLEVACIGNGKMYIDNQELAEQIDSSVRKYITGQAVTNQSTIFENLSTSTIIIPDRAGRNKMTYSNSLSKSPVTQSFSERKLSTGSSVIVSTPDSTDRSVLMVHQYASPSTNNYFSHSRSVSTSPEPRDDAGSDRREGHRNGDGSKEKVPRHKRPSHIHAESRRRLKIQACIDDLNQLLPPAPGGSRASTGSSKKSNAALLGRASSHCLQLEADVRKASREADDLRAEIEALTAEINSFHQELPADGVQQSVPASTVPLREMFDDYVRRRTMTNWKFYIFGLLIQPFFETYSRLVDNSSLEQFVRSMGQWMQDHFTLSTFRTNTTPVFRHISTSTSFMMTPERLPQEALQAVMIPSHDRFNAEAAVTRSNGSTESASSARRASLTLSNTHLIVKGIDPSAVFGNQAR